MSQLTVEVRVPANSSQCPRSGERIQAGLLMINADDWGRDQNTTDRTSECIRLGSVSSVSAMVFMQDSERAATVAQERGICVGLHLNFTTLFSTANVRPGLAEHQRQLLRYLRRHRLAQTLFHPGLMRSFDYVVKGQLEEFRRLYGTEPDRIDGHHHMHLCANVVLQKLLPFGTLVRRNFSFRKGEKGLCNRTYRRVVDSLLGRRHELMDFLFTLPPLEPERLDRIFSLARQFRVELETHPVIPEEYRFLTSGEIFHRTGDTPIAPGSAIARSRQIKNGIENRRDDR